MNKIRILFIIIITVIIFSCGGIADIVVKKITGTVIIDLYAGEGSTNSNGYLVAGYWKNGTWNSLPVLDSSQNSQVNSLFLVVTL